MRDLRASPSDLSELRRLLRERFGINDFRDGQRTAIEHLLAGRNTLVVMPTGSGKSLIYQFCALALPGTALVISPLIALMKDQVDRLSALGIPATFINSSIGAEEQQRRIEKMESGQWRLVYIAPERLRSATFINALRRVRVSLLAVDEAHCISQWGHDFRPDYLRIGAMRKALNDPVTVALTATATPEVQDDIIGQLGLPAVERVITGFARPNLVFHVRFTPDLQSKYRAIRKVLGAVRGAGIIYVATRRDAEELAQTLEAEYRLPVCVYHGGMERGQRALAQDAFLAQENAVMVATNAFGMGVDRPDVRFVVHYHIPGTLEAYYQEAGRAGRDGKPAQCMLLYAPQDRNLQEWFIENDAPSRSDLLRLHGVIASRAADGLVQLSPDELYRVTRLSEVKLRVGLSHLERVGALEMTSGEAQALCFAVRELSEDALSQIEADIRRWRAHKRAQLDKVIAYAETTTRCRQQMLIAHFGDTSEVRAWPCCDFHVREARGEAHPQFNVSAFPRPQADKAQDKQHSVDVTAQLLNAGMSIREVAAQRGLSLSTIYVHAAQLITAGRLELHRVVSAATEAEIRRAIAQVGSTERLAPIKALLPDTIDYGEIRCVVAQVKGPAAGRTGTDERADGAQTKGGQTS
ncbi:MAG: RecQ family ATP-dependent DNA helicase [Thermoflexales bacterium]|nr:RecQ family ATP-dependent DNA helicase [Thermoflexales bacterium]